MYARSALPVTASIDIVRQIGEGIPRREAGWLVWNSVGHLDGFEVFESTRSVGENGGNFPRGFLGKLLRGKPAVVKNRG